MNRSTTTVLAIAIALALGTVQPGLAATPGDPQWRAEIERIVKEAQDEARRARDGAQRDLERMQDTLTAQADALADVDLDFDGSTLAFFGNDFGAPREIVKNAPYTADAVTETVHVLQDGNRIVKRTVTRLARDTVGRTRQEKVGSRGTTAFLFDPIDNRNYALDLQRKVAVRIPHVPAPPVPPTPYVPHPPAVSVTPPPPPMPVAPGTPVAPMAPVPPSPSTSAPPGVAPLPPGGTPVAVAADGSRVIVRRGASGRAGDDVQVEVIRIGGDERASVAFPTLAMSLPEGRGEQKSLGTRDFDGVKAQGTQTTHTIPAGAIGNEKPIVIVRERWFSPELQLVVYVRNVDPRAGETTYRLTNMRRGEPPAELFRVPGDFRRRNDSRG